MTGRRIRSSTVARKGIYISSKSWRIFRFFEPFSAFILGVGGQPFFLAYLPFDQSDGHCMYAAVSRLWNLLLIYLYMILGYLGCHESFWAAFDVAFWYADVSFSLTWPSAFIYILLFFAIFCYFWYPRRFCRLLSSCVAIWFNRIYCLCCVIFGVGWRSWKR